MTTSQTTRTYFFVERQHEFRWLPAQTDDQGVMTVFRGREAAEAEMARINAGSEGTPAQNNLRVRSSTFDRDDAFRIG